MITLFQSLINNLSYVILIAFILSNFSIFREIIQRDNFKKSDLVVLSITFGVLGIIATYSGTDVNGAIANTRIIGIMTGGILYGPFVGIASGLIAGIHRFIYDIDGITSVPCAISTVLTGFVSGIIYRRRGKYEKWIYGFIGGIFMESIEMGLILLISRPYFHTLSIVKSIYLPMSFTNAVGIAILILLIQKIYDDKDELAAKQAQLALEIANRTLPYFREINSDSLKNICSIIRESTKAAAVAITDTKKILAYDGIGEDHHMKGEPIQTNTTKQVIRSGIMNISTSESETECFSKNCMPKSAIIVPLKEEEKVIGTLKLYYMKESGISYTNKQLAIGLSHLISTQLEISKVSNLKELATKAEIKALQAQINPHFLFNALNTIISFIRSNPNTARELIINLSTYLRYNIEANNSFVDIEKELEQVKAYVEIEKARFGDKLNVIYDIDTSIQLKIPSLIIQPLVENSIKHGILKDSGFGNVKITVKSHGKSEVYVSVEDDGIGISQEVIDNIYKGTIEENKIGLSNVNNRLKHIFGNSLMIERLSQGTCIWFILRDVQKKMN